MPIKLLRVFHVIGTIMYIGGVLSHIVIPIVAGEDIAALYRARH